MQVRRIKRPIHGVLLLDKPIGFSSNQALQKAKWLLQAAKAGHTGTLDPLATGLLPLCFGEATKFAHFLTDADKTYIATIKLGITTTTGDAEGEYLTVNDRHILASEFVAACKPFIGEISQMPPMYSALKHAGKPLYEYARAGIEIERKSRNVSIYSIKQNAFADNIATITVRCSKGTYIRTLAEDIGNALGCGAHLIGLRRTVTANYDIASAITLEQFEALASEERTAALLPIDSAILYLPAVKLDEDSSFYLLRGQAVQQSFVIPTGFLRLYNHNQEFLGLGELSLEGKIVPKRLIVNS